LFAGGEREIRESEIFDRTVWLKRCRTGNRHHKESSRETETRFHDALVAEGQEADISVAFWRGALAGIR